MGRGDTAEGLLHDGQRADLGMLKQDGQHAARSDDVPTPQCGELRAVNRELTHQVGQRGVLRVLTRIVPQQRDEARGLGLPVDVELAAPGIAEHQAGNVGSVGRGRNAVPVEVWRVERVARRLRPGC